MNGAFTLNDENDHGHSEGGILRLRSLRRVSFRQQRASGFARSAQDTAR
jgi:hypothetical protein